MLTVGTAMLVGFWSLPSLSKTYQTCPAVPFLRPNHWSATTSRRSCNCRLSHRNTYPTIWKLASLQVCINEEIPGRSLTKSGSCNNPCHSTNLQDSWRMVAHTCPDLALNDQFWLPTSCKTKSESIDSEPNYYPKAINTLILSSIAASNTGSSKLPTIFPRCQLFLFIRMDSENFCSKDL